MEIHGKSEMEAIKHVAYNTNHPQIQGYFNQPAVKDWSRRSVCEEVSDFPGLIAGGTGAVVYGRKNQSPTKAVRTAVRLEATQDVTELDIEIRFPQHWEGKDKGKI
jgi:hypothetical protein